VSGCTCQRAWNEVISKSYNTMKGDPNAPLCNVPREGCDSPTVPLKCAHYHYPAQPSATPYCTFQYPCTDDSQYVSDSLDWVMARYAATPIFLAGFSNGAQLSMSIACDTRIIDKVSAVISHHGTPSGDYCCWDNPHRPKAKATTGHKLQGFLHVAGQQGVDPTLPTFCSTQAAGYCDIAGYNYSSAQGNMECWNKTLGLGAHLLQCTVQLDKGSPYDRGVNPTQMKSNATCFQLQGSNVISCQGHVDHKWDAFFSTLSAEYIRHAAQGRVIALGPHCTQIRSFPAFNPAEVNASA